MLPRLLTICLTALAATSAKPATITVCSGTCDFDSLQAAVDAAEPLDTILLNYVGTMTESTVSIPKSLTIEGQSSALTIFQPAELPFAGVGPAIALVSPPFGSSITVTLRGFTVRHGDSNGGGAVTGSFGNASSKNTLRIENMIFHDNNGYNGGAILIQRGDLVMSDSLMFDNTAINLGGAVTAWNPGSGTSSISITSSTIRNNGAATAGGGVAVIGGVEAVIEETDIIDNGAAEAGGLWITGTETLVTINQSSVSGNAANTGGGGFLIQGGATVSLTNASATDNRANDDGGGFWLLEQAKLNLSNVHLFGNTAGESGGGVYHEGQLLSVANSTIRGNIADGNSDGMGDAGGIFLADGAESRLVSSIIADNDDQGGQYPDCRGQFSSGSFSLIGNTGPIFGLPACSVGGFTSGLLFDVPAGFGAVIGSGRLSVSPLTPGSPAIDAGRCNGAEGQVLAVDQRGEPMPVDGGTGSIECDMGSYEYGSGPVFRDSFESI